MKRKYRSKKIRIVGAVVFLALMIFSRLSLEGFLMCWSSTATSLLIRSSSYLHNTD